jgi:hypothetical protein
VLAELLSFCTLPREPGGEAGKTGGTEGEAAAAAGQATNTSYEGRADAKALDGKGVIESSLAVGGGGRGKEYIIIVEANRFTGKFGQ